MANYFACELDFYFEGSICIVVPILSADAASLEISMHDKIEGNSNSKPAKREKFVKLAEIRTRNAMRAIRIIAKLGNKNAYEYSEADVKKIASALNREVDALRARMVASGGKETVDFQL
jgi:hypothetical protein